MSDQMIASIAKAIWFARRNRQRVALGYEPLRGDEDVAVEGIMWAEALEAARAAYSILKPRIEQLEEALRRSKRLIGRSLDHGARVMSDQALGEALKGIEAALRARAQQEKTK